MNVKLFSLPFFIFITYWNLQKWEAKIRTPERSTLIMTCLFSRRKKITFHFTSIFAKSRFRNWKEKGLYFRRIFYRKHFLVLCHGLGFHTLVAGRMEMDMTVETSWLWNPDSKISRKMRKVWETLNDSCSNNFWTLWGDFEMAANTTWLWPASCTL